MIKFIAPKPQSSALDDALEKKILALIKEAPQITQNEIMSKTDLPRATLQRCMKKMTENGTIERKGGKRFGYWQINSNS